MKLSFILFLFSSLVLVSCSGSQRFGNDDSESNENYNDEEYKVLETVEGVASYYSDEFHGRKTANGETYDMYGLTAAHKTFPFNTEVRVTNLSNGKSIVLRINDRMPGYKGRIIDISFQAARELGMIISGTANVKVEVLSWGE
ncbi:MAG TPA: septal ring lytic transglycosylase RlpA family protein [Ignavibacteriaceae bacterium]|nr:septal ring lytic transglycosylase RlpA family protein [Ignavibacteriaceae bacterium]